MGIVTVNDTSLSAIGSAIREKNGSTDKYKPSEMAEAIANIKVGEEMPEEAFTITGNCIYRFAYNAWNWYINAYKDKITTKDITNANSMFCASGTLESVPFELNFRTNTSHGLNYAFQGCYALKTIPKFNNCNPANTGYMFENCYNLRYLPDGFADWFDWSYMKTNTSTSLSSKNMFAGCRSLRSVPMAFLTYGGKNTAYNYSYFYNGFTNAYSLDELVGLPIPYETTWTSNSFYSTFHSCFRLKNLTFETNVDGTPLVKQWKNQTIYLNSGLGWNNSTTVDLTAINSGITPDKEVTDDASYQALKNNPDWFSKNMAYSRYNHDSAVATINSLPDTSAYLASAGGTNNIRFFGNAGSKTDGGAVNTLTAEEIAVATAKGWTVSM